MATKLDKNVIVIDKRNWWSIAVKIIVNYLILGVGAFVATMEFTGMEYLLPLICFGANYFSTIDRYELYFLDSGLLMFALIAFVMALFYPGDVEQSGFAMLLALFGVFEIAILALVLDKIKMNATKNKVKLLDVEEEKLKLGIFSIKLVIVMSVLFLLMQFV